MLCWASCYAARVRRAQSLRWIIEIQGKSQRLHQLVSCKPRPWQWQITLKPQLLQTIDYYIRTRACANAAEPVYKIGKTTQTVYKRLAGYDKGYEILMIRPVPRRSLDALEREAIAMLRGAFGARTDYGSEYFEGDCFDMVQMLSQLPEAGAAA